MITYEQALDYIHRHNAHSAKPGLHRISALLEQLGNPHKAGLPLLHIAGTNGKGSTATMLASVLKEAGYKVGCFTSPFIYDFRERFAINGKMIEKEQLTKLAEQVMQAEQFLDEQPTEFEIVTAIGFLYFQGCDIIVLEVGLGGRFDATNIIDQPLASVICSISLDHTEFLGNTISEIAYEKAGIIKKNCPTILYGKNTKEAIETIQKRCDECSSPLTLCAPTEPISCDIDGTSFRYKDQDYFVSLRGAHQADNAAVAIETLLLIRDRFPFTQEQLQNGLANAFIPSRLECICKEPYIFIDGGHNKDGIDMLLSAMDQWEELKNPTIIFGMMKDKPYQYAVRQLASRAKTFLTVQPPLPRAMTAYDLKNMADLFCDDCISCDSYEQAAKLAMEKHSGCILAAGSLYLAGEIAKELKKFI